VWGDLFEVQAWSSRGAARQKRIVAVWALLCVLVVAALYWPIIFTGFRIPDHDERLIINAVRPHGLLGARHYFESSFWGRTISPTYVYYRPIALTSHAIDYCLWGENPHPSHAVNLALHAIAVLLLGWLVALLAGNWLPGMMAGALYAVLPTHAEPVAWIAARMDLLCGMFTLAAMIALMLAHQRRAWSLVATGALLFLLAVGSKETGGALVAVVLAWALTTRRGTRRLALCAAAIVGALAVGYIAFRHFSGTIVAPPQRHPFRHLGMRLHGYYLSRPLARLWEAIQLRSLGWADGLGLARGVGAGVLLMGSLSAALVMLTWRIAFYLPALIFVQADDRYLYAPEMGSAALIGIVLWQAARWLRRCREGLQWLAIGAYAWLVIAQAAALRQALLPWQAF